MVDTSYMGSCGTPQQLRRLGTGLSDRARASVGFRPHYVLSPDPHGDVCACSLVSVRTRGTKLMCCRVQTSRNRSAVYGAPLEHHFVVFHHIPAVCVSHSLSHVCVPCYGQGVGSPGFHGSSSQQGFTSPSNNMSGGNMSNNQADAKGFTGVQQKVTFLVLSVPNFSHFSSRH